MNRSKDWGPPTTSPRGVSCMQGNIWVARVNSFQIHWTLLHFFLYSRNVDHQKSFSSFLSSSYMFQLIFRQSINVHSWLEMMKVPRHWKIKIQIVKHAQVIHDSLTHFFPHTYIVWFYLQSHVLQLQHVTVRHTHKHTHTHTHTQ